MKILICGQPSSGNRLVATILKAAGAETEILHTYEEIRDADQWGMRRDPAWQGMVVIIRSQPFWDASIDKQGDRRALIRQSAGVGAGDGSLLELLFLTLTAAKPLHIPSAVITYEALVHHPEEICAHLYSTFGLTAPDPLVPVEVYDANHKPDAEKPPENRSAPVVAGKPQTISPTGFRAYNQFMGGK